MKLVLKNIKSEKPVITAYMALTLFIAGVVSVGFGSYRLYKTGQFNQEQAKISQNIHKKRFEAMEQAKREGKNEYSFTIDKAPIAISQ